MEREEREMVLEDKSGGGKGYAGSTGEAGHDSRSAVGFTGSTGASGARSRRAGSAARAARARFASHGRVLLCRRVRGDGRLLGAVGPDLEYWRGVVHLRVCWRKCRDRDQKSTKVVTLTRKAQPLTLELVVGRVDKQQCEPAGSRGDVEENLRSACNCDGGSRVSDVSGRLLLQNERALLTVCGGERVGYLEVAVEDRRVGVDQGDGEVLGVGRVR